MMIAANRAIGKPLPSFDEVSTSDMIDYREIVEFFFKHPDASPSAFYDKWGGDKPYESLPMETRIMYARLHRAAAEALQEERERGDTPEPKQGWFVRLCKWLKKWLLDTPII